MPTEARPPKYPILDEIEVPEHVLANWQLTVDLLAELAWVPAALIVRAHAREIEVLVSSRSPGNAYHPGETAPLDTGHYCETVMRTRKKLLVPNALKDPKWDHNPDIGLGMISYCGLPLTWPTGEIFGTLCILDTKENTFDYPANPILERFHESVLFSLASIHEASQARRQMGDAEHALRESESRSQRYLDTTQTVMVALDAKGCITLINRAGQALLGYAEAELLGHNWFSTCLPQPEGVDSVYPVFQHIMAGELEAYTQFENEVLCRDGNRRLVGWRNTYFRDDAGRIIGTLSSGEDITERRRAEEALYQSQKLLKETEQIGKVGGWEFDMDTGQQKWTEETYRIHEVDSAYDPTVGKGINFYTPASRPVIEQAVRRAVEHGEPFDVELEITTAKGNIRSVHAIGKADTAHRRIYGFFQDITERKRMERELERHRNHLEELVQDRTNELETANLELESFAYSVSHDLRVPLRAIDGFSQLLLKHSAPMLDDEGRRLLNVVRDNTRRMGQLIDDILAFSRAGRLEMKRSETDMNKLARDAWQDFAPLLENRKARLDTGVLPGARGDPAMLRQVFANLLSNAVKFTSRKAEALIEIGGSRQNNECVYYVKDNGAGFDMRYADKLFGVFQRLHGAEEFEGTGIGLAIVKCIITRHGGRVWAEGEVNGGATVYFALPEKTGN